MFNINFVDPHKFNLIQTNHQILQLSELELICSPSNNSNKTISKIFLRKLLFKLLIPSQRKRLIAEELLLQYFNSGFGFFEV